MSYDGLIETISLIAGNDKILKEGLTLVYELDEKKHKQMNEQLFYMNKDNLNEKFVGCDVFEVMLDKILVKFVKQQILEK
jgi:hypothetical protein